MARINANIGQKIKEVFEEKQMKLKDFAVEIGVARQNIYRIFEKDSIDTALLIKISTVLNHNFFQYFQNEIPGLPKGISSGRTEDTDLYRELDTCRHELKLAKKEIDYLKKIIELMEERTKFLIEKNNFKEKILTGSDGE